MTGAGIGSTNIEELMFDPSVPSGVNVPVQEVNQYLCKQNYVSMKYEPKWDLLESNTTNNTEKYEN